MKQNHWLQSLLHAGSGKKKSSESGSNRFDTRQNYRFASLTGKKALSLLLAFGLLAGTLSGCASKKEASSTASSAASSAVSSAASSASSAAEKDSQSLASSISSMADVAPDSQTPNPTSGTPSLSSIPPYAGNPSVEVNGNVPFFEKNEWTTTSFQHYFDLDSLGRVTLAYASIGPDLLPEEKRGDISEIHPTGFINHSYPFVEQGMVYNRCHLIAFMLSGQNANPKNLMTGTRYMNVEGMLPYENKVHEYIEKTGNHVMYRVTPMFEGNDLVAKGVLMEALSVEDQGAGVEFCVFCYNVQPGVAIDYATGENQADGTISAGAPAGENPAPAPAPAPAPSAAEGQAEHYVLNTRSHKFHRPDCEGVAKMSAKNRQDVTESREQIIAAGYEPCKICNP